jgi:hypothetical protein
MDGSGVNNDLEQAEQIGQLGETALSVSFPKTKLTHAPAQDCFRCWRPRRDLNPCYRRERTYQIATLRQC